MLTRLRRAAVLLVATVAVSGGLLAVVSGVPAAAKTDADRAEIQRAVDELEKDPTKKAIAGDQLTRARRALDRANRLRGAGDEAHARLADSVAQAWLESARETLRASDVEAAARRTQLEAADAGTQVERARALVEEATMQSGRARAQLEAAERDAKAARDAKEARDVKDKGPRDAGAAPRGNR